MLSRKLTSALLILSISMSTMLFIGIQKISDGAKKSFSHSLSGTDLLIGARSGDIQLLLYTIFRQGKPVANMSWDSVMAIKANKNVDWLVPISLGDSHKHFPVLGTNNAYFNHYRYGNKINLKLDGRPFKRPFEAVIGSQVAKKLNYSLGQKIHLSHGISQGNLPIHAHHSFQITGILKPTGTPVDKTIHVPQEGITAIHLNWSQQKTKALNIDELDLTPSSVTSCLVGLKSKFSIFSFQQTITQWKKEPLMAIIPGVTLAQLWRNMSTIDTAFLIVTIGVTLIAFIGLLLGLFLSLQQRNNELAILRLMGAHPRQLSIMLLLESTIITMLSVLFGGILTRLIGWFMHPMLEERLGLILNTHAITSTEIYFSLSVVGCGIFIGLIPAVFAYKKGKKKGFMSI
jgi:putative ABC transport system permease protein